MSRTFPSVEPRHNEKMTRGLGGQGRLFIGVLSFYQKKYYTKFDLDVFWTVSRTRSIHGVSRHLAQEARESGPYFCVGHIYAWFSVSVVVPSLWLHHHEWMERDNKQKVSFFLPCIRYSLAPHFLSSIKFDMENSIWVKGWNDLPHTYIHSICNENVDGMPLLNFFTLKNSECRLHIYTTPLCASPLK